MTAPCQLCWMFSLKMLQKILLTFFRNVSKYLPHFAKMLKQQSILNWRTFLLSLPLCNLLVFRGKGLRFYIKYLKFYLQLNVPLSLSPSVRSHCFYQTFLFRKLPLYLSQVVLKIVGYIFCCTMSKAVAYIGFSQGKPFPRFNQGLIWGFDPHHYWHCSNDWRGSNTTYQLTSPVKLQLLWFML